MRKCIATVNALLGRHIEWQKPGVDKHVQLLQREDTHKIDWDAWRNRGPVCI